MLLNPDDPTLGAGLADNEEKTVAVSKEARPSCGPNAGRRKLAHSPHLPIIFPHREIWMPVDFSGRGRIEVADITQLFRFKNA
jgi:hypothetical protein